MNNSTPLVKRFCQDCRWYGAGTMCPANCHGGAPNDLSCFEKKTSDNGSNSDG